MKKEKNSKELLFMMKDWVMILIQNTNVLLLCRKTKRSLLSQVNNIIPESLLNLTFDPASCDDVPLPLHAIAENINQFEDVSCSELLEEFKNSFLIMIIN